MAKIILLPILLLFFFGSELTKPDFDSELKMEKYEEIESACITTCLIGPEKSVYRDVTFRWVCGTGCDCDFKAIKASQDTPPFGTCDTSNPIEN